MSAMLTLEDARELTGLTTSQVMEHALAGRVGYRRRR
jgi:hypothetical protein